LPEVIGEKIDKRTLRKTGRTEQFATRVSKEWLGKVKGVAEKENLKLVEVLEKLLENYDKRSVVQLSNEQLLKMLGEKITNKEIKSDGNRDYLYVADQHFNKIIVVEINTGKTKHNQVNGKDKNKKQPKPKSYFLTKK
jgi:hypothetical protein